VSPATQGPGVANNTLTSADHSAESLKPWLTLVHTQGLGPGILRKLQEALGSVEAVLNASNSQLRNAGASDKVINAFNNVDAQLINDDLEWLDESDDRFIIPRTSDYYPHLLKEIADPPLVLYVRGDPEVLNTPQLAIVGSRKAGHSADRHAFEMAAALAGYGITITSGLALGIDGSAHRGALHADGFTVAVTATGLDRVYPATHQQLAREIAERSAVISEFPIGTNPRASFFPRRNRIISGLCYGTLVVEAALKSGTLTTAAHATSQAREVFAIPGNIDNPQSRGCHALLKKGATLVESVEDILEVLAPILPKSLLFPDSDAGGNRDTRPAHPQSVKSISLEARQVLDSLGHDALSLDQLADRSGLNVVVVTNLTADLELEGVIEKVAGGNFVTTGAKLTSQE